MRCMRIESKATRTRCTQIGAAAWSRTSQNRFPKHAVVWSEAVFVQREVCHGHHGSEPICVTKNL
jgi:hypothetical protein